MENFKLRNCFKKLIPIIIEELSEEFHSDYDGSKLSKIFNIDPKFSSRFQMQDVGLRITKIIHYWITINERNSTVLDLLKILEDNGRSKAKDTILTKMSIERPVAIDKDEPGHIPRFKDISAASEIFYDNQSLLVFGKFGVGKTYFVKRLLKICSQDETDNPSETIIWIDFDNFTTSLHDACSKLKINIKKRKEPYDLVMYILKAQPDFVILDGFNCTHEVGKEYWTLCQNFQKEYYFKLIVITEDAQQPEDFDLVIQIEPFDPDQVRKFVAGTELEHQPQEIFDFCAGNPGVLSTFMGLAKGGKLTEEHDIMLMIRNHVSNMRDIKPVPDQRQIVKTTNTEIQIIFKTFGTLVPPIILPGGEVTASVERKWIDLMQENDIPFNPEFHSLVKSASKNCVVLNADDKIRKFHAMFRKNQNNYMVYIKAKKNTTQDPRTSRRARTRGNCPVGNLTESAQPIPATPRDVHMEDAETRPVPRKSLVVAEQLMHEPIGQVASSSRSIRNSARTNFVPRDENTYQGNIIGEGEVQVSGLVRSGFARISNRDMLQIWREVRTVRDTGNFNAVTRLMPFTAGTLRSVFLDGLQNLENDIRE